LKRDAFVVVNERTTVNFQL